MNNRDLFNKIKKFIIKSFKNCGYKEHIKHLERTVYWIKRLKPDADEPILIAALSHDIETAHKWKNINEKPPISYIDKDFIESHQRRGAEIIENFLKEEGIEAEIISKIKSLILKHEEGGDEDQNLLKDADSISFFENSVPIFLEMAKKVGKEKIKEKFDWMYNRITSEKVKKIVEKWYKQAIEDLEAL